MVKFSTGKFAFRSVFGLALSLAGFSFLSQPVSAQRISKINGATLAHLCTTPAQLRICDAYLSGVSDSEVWAGKYDEKMSHQVSPAAFCIPPSQSLAQIRGLVAAWLNAHPESGKIPAGKAVYLALHSSYPCKPSEAAPKSK